MLSCCHARLTFSKGYGTLCYMTTDQLQLNFPPSDTQSQWRLGLYRDDVLVSDGLFESFEHAVTFRKNLVTRAQRAGRRRSRVLWQGISHDGVLWEDSARGTGWFGVKNVPGESTTVYALFITKT